MNERPTHSKEAQAATPGVEPHDVDSVPENELFADPADYSAIGGPENEAAYGRTRSLAGEHPFNQNGGPHDRDEPSQVPRGGIQTHHHVDKRT